MDYLAQVSLEITLGKCFQIGESSSWNISLPLKVSLASFDETTEFRLSVHEGYKCLGELELVSGNRAFSAGQGKSSLLLIGNSIPGQISSFSHVGGEKDHVVVLVDVIHNLIRKLRLGNVLSQLFNSVTSSFGSSVLVHHFIQLVLGIDSVLDLAHQFHDHGEFSAEESILSRIHGVLVHLKEVKINSGNGLNKTLEGGIDLELLEQTGDDTASGSSGKSDLVVDDDGSVDRTSDQSLTNGVKISLARGGGVPFGDPHVNKARIFPLQLFQLFVQ